MLCLTTAPTSEALSLAMPVATTAIERHVRAVTEVVDEPSIPEDAARRWCVAMMVSTLVVPLRCSRVAICDLLAGL